MDWTPTFRCETPIFNQSLGFADFGIGLPPHLVWIMSNIRTADLMSVFV
jgi:hypothetical protein